MGGADPRMRDGRMSNDRDCHDYTHNEAEAEAMHCLLCTDIREMPRKSLSKMMKAALMSLFLLWSGGAEGMV